MQSCYSLCYYVVLISQRGTRQRVVIVTCAAIVVLSFFAVHRVLVQFGCSACSWVQLRSPFLHTSMSDSCSSILYKTWVPVRFVQLEFDSIPMSIVLRRSATCIFTYPLITQLKFIKTGSSKAEVSK